jgi:hypothetical protein
MSKTITTTVINVNFGEMQNGDSRQPPLARWAASLSNLMATDRDLNE